MSRVQLAINVSDLGASIEFYSKLFNAAPAEVRDGYASFAVADPPLKLVLVQGEGVPGSLHHLGVEATSSELVGSAIGRLQPAGTADAAPEQISPVFELRDNVRVHGPDTEPWDVYVLVDAPVTCEVAIIPDAPSAESVAADTEPGIQR